ncbi:MAG: tyrosine-type recombinase/integrase [Chloroflexota bacterium]|nr:tyrosine-type recombinase/integrase [Chloroflexota bacterium]
MDLKSHDFRHHLAAFLLNQGVQITQVQDILGHASPETTKAIHAHYDKQTAFTRFRKPLDKL